MRLFVLALALCLIPFPAYAHGLDIPAELVFGVVFSIGAAFGAAFTLPGKFRHAILYFIAALLGGAVCAIVLGVPVGLIKGSRSAHVNEAIAYVKWPHFMFLPLAIAIGGFLAATYVSMLREGKTLRDSKGALLMLKIWAGLAALSILVPLWMSLHYS